VHVLLAQGREEANWDKAQEKYRAIQKHIVTGGDQLELYGDVDRLIPDDVDPVCEEQVMPVEEYVREKVKDRGSRAADSPREAAPGNKVKRNMDPGRNIPEGTSAAFMPVSQLVEKAAERILQEGMTLDDDASVKDKSDSRDLEESFSHLRRATSDTGPIPAASKVQTARKRNETTVNEGKRKRAINTPARGSHKKTPGQRKRTKVSNGEANQVLGEGDETLGGGLPPAHPPPGSPISIHSSSGSEPPSRMLYLPPPDGPPLSDNKHPFCITLSPSPPRITSAPVSPSPSSRARSTNPDPLFVSAPQHDIEGGTPLIVDGDEQGNGYAANETVVKLSTSPVGTKRRTSPGMANSNCDVSVAEGPKIAGKRTTRTKFEPTEGLAKRPAKRKEPGSGSSLPVASPPRRLRRRRTRSISPSPRPPPGERTKRVIREGKKPRRDKTRTQMAPGWVTKEAVHSGEEVSDGAISAAGQSENEYDREFVNDSPSTPISPSYNQMQIYQESLLSQNTRDEGLPFGRGPMRRKPFGNIDRKLPQFSSSPTRDPEEGPDEYEMGSFVVPDDVEMSCSLSSEL
jgi:ATP-dependent DNA helicase MPH1